MIFGNDEGHFHVDPESDPPEAIKYLVEILNKQQEEVKGSIAFQQSMFLHELTSLFNEMEDHSLHTLWSLCNMIANASSPRQLACNTLGRIETVGLMRFGPEFVTAGYDPSRNKRAKEG